MMDSSNLNLDLHHQEDYFHGSSSSITALPFHFVGRNHDSWNQDLPLNSADNFIQNANGVGSAPRDFMRLSHDMPIVQDLGYQWGDQEGSGYMMNHSSHQELLSKNIKEELSESFAKLSGINLQNYHLIMPRNDDPHKVNGLPPPAADVGFDPMISSMGSFGRGSFSMVLPTTNISDLDPLPSSSYSNTLGMDVQALDLLASGRFGRTLCQPTMDNMALLREDLAYGLGQLQEPAQQATQIKISHTISGVSNQQSHKANGGSLEYKASQSVAKKPRFESRASFTPFKVRKEKLGDRIAALQQLVAPFGKTDTASVLMEAIGYIKFLQDQVETLSVPYMRSSNTKKTRTSGEASSDEREEPKLDLRSRGLCLVPLSCTSYVTNENGGVWSPPNYRGGT